MEVLQPCERDGSPAPEGILKNKPIHFFITRKRCHFKLPNNLPFFGGEYEDEDDDLGTGDEDDEDDEDLSPTPPASPICSSLPTTTPSLPQAAVEAIPSLPPGTPAVVIINAAPAPTVQTPFASAIVGSAVPSIGAPPHTTTTSTTTTTTTTTTILPAHPISHSYSHSPAASTNKRAPAQNRDLLLFVKINNNYYEIRGGLTTKCLGAKKEPEKEDNLIIGRWLWLTCVSNNNKTGVNFTMKSLLVIAGTSCLPPSSTLQSVLLNFSTNLFL